MLYLIVLRMGLVTPEMIFPGTPRMFCTSGAPQEVRRVVMTASRMKRVVFMVGCLYFLL
jgi:uncharacterized metal-binding protein